MDEFETSLKIWRAPDPASGLADRIVTHVVTHSSDGAVWRERVKRALTEWRYGLVYKAAVLAACAVIAVGVGYSAMQPVYDDETDLEEIAFIVGI